MYHMTTRGSQSSRSFFLGWKASILGKDQNFHFDIGSTRDLKNGQLRRTSQSVEVVLFF
jgi:hypothetical protein